MILEDAVNRQQQGNSNLELAVLTSMQASLQQLITRVGTLETDLRAVKDVTKRSNTQSKFTKQECHFLCNLFMKSLSTFKMNFQQYSHCLKCWNKKRYGYNIVTNYKC